MLLIDPPVDARAPLAALIAWRAQLTELAAHVRALDGPDAEDLEDVRFALRQVDAWISARSQALAGPRILPPTTNGGPP